MAKMKQAPSLFNHANVEELTKQKTVTENSNFGKQGTRLIPLKLIDDSEFNEGMPLEDIDELADSIRQTGLLEPIILYEKTNGRYECLSGHRRRKALESIGATEVEAIVRPEEKNIVTKFRAHTDANTQNREKTTNFWLSRIKAAGKVLTQTGFTGTKDEQVARIAQMLGKGASKSQIYHLEAFEKLHPELKSLEAEKIVSVHTLYSAVSLTKEQQKEAARETRKRISTDNSGEPKISKAQFDAIVKEIKAKPEKGEKIGQEKQRRKNRAGYAERIERDSLKLLGEMKKAHTEEEKEKLHEVIGMIEKSLAELKATL